MAKVDKQKIRKVLDHMKEDAPYHARAFEALTESFVKFDKTEIRIEVAELSGDARGATSPKTIAKLAQAAREVFKVDAIRVWICVGGMMT